MPLSTITARAAARLIRERFQTASWFGHVFSGMNPPGAHDGTEVLYLYVHSTEGALRGLYQAMGFPALQFEGFPVLVRECGKSSSGTAEPCRGK